MIKLARIVKSNSHVDYVGRIIDVLDADEPPSAADYGFAQFVSIPLTEGLDVVGVIYNSLLANPDYGNYGPRLSTVADLSVLSPDYLNEQGLLVGILLLGWREGGVCHHAMPRRVIPVNQEVYHRARGAFRRASPGGGHRTTGAWLRGGRAAASLRAQTDARLATYGRRNASLRRWTIRPVAEGQPQANGLCLFIAHSIHSQLNQ
jgi:hypothetical protein